MQLGRILESDPGQPTTGREVEFDLVARASGNRTVRKRCKAVLCFVSEPDRKLALRLAQEQLRKDWKDGASESEQFLEEQKWLLAQALRDCDDQTVSFVDAASMESFRFGLVPMVVNWLSMEFADFLKDEYPYCVTPAERKRLEEEAEKNSKAGRDSSGKS